ncbi:hypothetical protein [Brevundimonas sp.]|uniref:hypothetical protein n=1 Tax=Brevundimonas sp. TaxID=1871086 RepID=UPI003A8DDAC6
MRIAAFVAVLALGLPAHGLAQAPSSRDDGARLPDPVPIEEWTTDKVSRIGLEMYRLDRAAWLATDALRETITAQELTTVRGWLVEPAGNGHRVRFYREGDPDPVPGWDIVVTRTAGPVTPTTETRLTPVELAQTRALTTARANIGELRCSARVNTVIMPDPDTDDWLVWLLVPTPDSGAIPVGGHYRFRISPDGQSVLRRDQLSNGCFFADPAPEGSRDTMLFYTQIVSRGPVETQVFLSIQKQMTLLIVAGGRYFSVGGARIADITDMVNQR